MLSTDICKKCIGEEEWKKIANYLIAGFIPCKVKHNLSIYKEPPEKCPYLLEHMMDSQDVVRQKKKILNGKVYLIQERLPEKS